MGIREELRNSVKFYQRHIFVNTGNRPWHARVEDSDELVARLVQALGRSPRILPPTRVTAYRTPDTTSQGDFLVFPDRLCYTPAPEQPENQIIQELAGFETGGPLESENLDGIFFFVCVHGERDPRCGQCGPPIMETLEEYLSSQNLTSKWHVNPCSHVGGHRYAANLLVYPGGHWYGYVTPEAVKEIVDHAVKGKIFQPLFRGQMSPP